MKQIAKLALTGLAGFALGAGAIQGLHAQAGKRPGYVIAEVQITDQAAFDAYGKKAAEALKAANARVLVRGKGEAKEGAPPQGVVYVIQFDSLADAEKWYSQPPYQPLIAEREKASKTRLFLAEGLPQ